jgi:hypothetical protein
MYQYREYLALAPCPKSVDGLVSVDVSTLTMSCNMRALVRVRALQDRRHSTPPSLPSLIAYCQQRTCAAKAVDTTRLPGRKGKG